MPAAGMPPPPLSVDQAAYQDMMAQHNKWLEMTAAAVGTDVMTLQTMIYQSPIVLQQQMMWQQQVREVERERERERERGREGEWEGGLERYWWKEK